VAEGDEAIGVGVWERAQQNGVYDAEDRGGRADAECESEYRRRHENRRAAKPTNDRGYVE
jgi:hypothetical protein